VRDGSARAAIFADSKEEAIAMKRAADVEDLSTLRERVEQWRAQRTKRSRIPDELWMAAVRVARVEGAYATHKATRFNYDSLKSRMALVQTQARQPRAEAIETSAFIELGGVQLAEGRCTTVVEIVGRRGGRMRIDVSGGSGMDVVGLAQAFWSHEA
jgi:hypothetical protein